MVCPDSVAWPSSVVWPLVGPLLGWGPSGRSQLEEWAVEAVRSFAPPPRPIASAQHPLLVGAKLHTSGKLRAFVKEAARPLRSPPPPASGAKLRAICRGKSGGRRVKPRASQRPLVELGARLRAPPEGRGRTRAGPRGGWRRRRKRRPSRDLRWHTSRCRRLARGWGLRQQRRTRRPARSRTPASPMRRLEALQSSRASRPGRRGLRLGEVTWRGAPCYGGLLRPSRPNSTSPRIKRVCVVSEEAGLMLVGG